MDKNGFTLAEVLITLAIIGTIAASTIPTIQNSIKKHEYVGRFQKAYLTLYDAIQLSEIDNDPIEDWDYSNSISFMNTYLKPYLKVIKSCDDVANGCWTGNKINYMSAGAEAITGRPGFILSDGTFLTFLAQGIHIHIYIDLDGYKGQNKYGKDVFIFTLTPTSLADGTHQVTKPGLYPYGAWLDRNTLINNANGCSKTSYGQMCGALIFTDGWQIQDDYPL